MAPPPGGAGGGSANPILTFLPFVLMIVVVWFLLIRPQRKRQKELQTMLSQLNKGDKVVTSSGILGTIVGITESRVVLRVGDDPKSETKIEMLKSAIAGRMEKE
ncbi:MAG: preprotein translocase subunit YajC [candidate division Zixibacteria bacterium]|nr:preprotein translocase subunit YajC [candidate division Zixibacteria bacterium]